MKVFFTPTVTNYILARCYIKKIARALEGGGGRKKYKPFKLWGPRQNRSHFFNLCCRKYCFATPAPRGIHRSHLEITVFKTMALALCKFLCGRGRQKYIRFAQIDLRFLSLKSLKVKLTFTHPKYPVGNIFFFRLSIVQELTFWIT